MKKKKELKSFLKDAETLLAIPIQKRYTSLVLNEYPFDAQLLSLSRLYRESRKHYLSLGGTYTPKVCSTMRSLSSHDIFKDEIEFTPLQSELQWFTTHHHEVADPDSLMRALSCFSQISLFHEQNHRVIWRLLPPAPTEQRDFCRYLNFAESLVVTLDLALGDEIGLKFSPAFERFKCLYRPGGPERWAQLSKKEYRQYLHALFYSTYLTLELIHREDILKAVNYVCNSPTPMNKAAVRRALELNELFTFNTNQQWQERNWKSAQQKLEIFHAHSIEEALYLPEDPLDFDQEFNLVDKIFDFFRV